MSATNPQTEAQPLDFTRARRAFYWEELRPSKTAIGVQALLLLLVLGYACSLVAEAATVEVIGIFCTGPVFLLPLLALLPKNKPAARTYPLLAGSFAIGLIGLLTAILISQLPQENAASGLGFLFFIPFPFALTLLIPAGFLMRNMARRLQNGLTALRVEYAGKLVRQYGELSFTELARLLLTATTEVDNLLDLLMEKRGNAFWVSVPYQRVMTNGRLRQKQAALLQLIRDRGFIFLDDLAIEMNLPRRLLTDWIYQHVHLRRFSGYINWETGGIYSMAAEQLRENSRCPNCTSQLSLVGETVRCPACQSEILLGGG